MCAADVAGADGAEEGLEGGYDGVHAPYGAFLCFGARASGFAWALSEDGDVVPDGGDDVADSASDVAEDG